jgi:glycosyltransferase involved in cell wall biosynthesis
VSRNHICFLVGTLSQGGAERQLYYMLRVLQKNCKTLTVLCLTKGEYWEERIKALGIPVVWVGQHETRVLRLQAILREIRRLKPDLLQSSHFFTNLPAAIAGRLFGIPAIGAVRNDCLNEVAGVGILVGKLNLRVPRWLAGNSRAGLENARMQGVSGRSLFFLPNVVDCTEFRFSPRAAHNPVRIVTAGRLVQQKRQDRFIRLIARLRSSMPLAIQGVIAGDGPTLEQLRRQIEELQLSPHDIELRGVSTDMKNLYHQADIFVLTSDWEGTPNVVLEAMASGVPVVSTDVGDVRELIDDGVTGFVVSRHAEDDLFSRVAQLAEDSSRRKTFAESARRRIEMNFSLERLSDYLNSLHSMVVDGGEQEGTRLVKNGTGHAREGEH